MEEHDFRTIVSRFIGFDQHRDRFLNNRGVRRTHPAFERLLPKAIWGAREPSNTIYVTFDDGPDSTNTPEILNELDYLGIPATFFFRGDRILSNRNFFENPLLHNHELGFHGFSHTPLWFKKPTELAVELHPDVVLKCAPELSSLYNERPFLIRPPYGKLDFAVLGAAERMDSKIIMWRLVTGDWFPEKTTEQISNHLLTETQPGDIIVLHDGGVNGHLLPEVLRTVLPVWKLKGYRFSTVRELMTEG